MKTAFPLTVSLFLYLFSLDSVGAEANGQRIVQAARSQIGTTVRYDPAYRALDYPNGDVPAETSITAAFPICKRSSPGITKSYPGLIAPRTTAPAIWSPAQWVATFRTS
jgi:hypothetical protein